MMPEQSAHWAETQDLVDAYIMHRLSPEETERCSIHLASCKACAEIVRKETVLIGGIKQYGRGQLKVRLQERLAEEESSRFEWRRVISIAAVMLVMSVSAAFFYWMTHEGGGRNRMREIVMQEHQTSLWLIGKVVVKPEPFRGKLTGGIWAFRLQHDHTSCLLHIRQAAPEALPPEKKHLAAAAEEIPSSLERTADGVQLTVYMNEGDHTHLAGISPTGASSFILYIEGTQIAYQLPEGWI